MNCELKKVIAIVCGGDSSEHDVSMRSAAGIASFLDKERYIIYKVEVHAMKWEALIGEDEKRTPVDRNDFSFLNDNEQLYARHGRIGSRQSDSENWARP